MTATRAKPLKFDPNKFLTNIGEGKTTVSFPKKHTVFAQGASSDAVFYIQKGTVKLFVVSSNSSRSRAKRFSLEFKSWTTKVSSYRIFRANR